jgi:hypothetical protein
MNKHTNETRADETSDRHTADAAKRGWRRGDSAGHTMRRLTRAGFRLSDVNVKHDVRRLSRARYMSDVSLKHDVRRLSRARFLSDVSLKHDVQRIS